MSLNRVTMAADTLSEFVLLRQTEQKIIAHLLLNRNLREKPLKPSQYYSHRDIAEAIGLPENSVRVRISELCKNGWLMNTSQRKRYRADGTLETQNRWSVTKVIEGLERVYQAEQEAEEQQFIEPAPADDASLFEFEGRVWRQGSDLGFESRSLKGSLWASTMIPPAEVRQHFS